MIYRNATGCLVCLLSIFIAILVHAIGSAADEVEPQHDGSAFPMESGPFDDTWESLEQYECPEWFRDAKFGYKDLIEKFDPQKLDFDKLVGLYKQAGARYAVILAVHHDNFDLWNSKHHEWNSVNKGPKRTWLASFAMPQPGTTSDSG